MDGMIVSFARKGTRSDRAVNDNDDDDGGDGGGGVSYSYRQFSRWLPWLASLTSSGWRRQSTPQGRLAGRASSCRRTRP